MKHLALLVLVATACTNDTAAPSQEPAPDPGRMHVQISGAVQRTSEWEAFGQFRDVLESDQRDVSLMRGQNIALTGTDSNFTVIFPGQLDVGHFAIGRYTPGVAVTAPVAYVVLDSGFYASLPGGTIAVDSAGYPARPGLALGGIRGTLTFKAVRLAAGGVATSDTITVRATFAAHWYHYIFPNVSVTLNGAGPVTGVSTFSNGLSSVDDHGGRFVSWDADFGATHTFPHDMSQEIRMLAPSIGTFPVVPTTPTEWVDPARWPAIYTAVFYRDDPRLALSTGGTLTVTQLVEPTDEFYGEIHGALTSRLALWSDTTRLSGDSVNVSVTFAVQLWPLGGIPNSTRQPLTPDPPLRSGAGERW